MCLPVRSEGTRYFFLSRSPILALGAFSTITCVQRKREVSKLQRIFLKWILSGSEKKRTIEDVTPPALFTV